MAILIALPFSAVMLAMCVGVWRAFHREHQAYLRARRRALRRELTEHMEEHFEGRFEEVLDQVGNGEVSRNPDVGADAPVESARRRWNPFRRSSPSQ